MKIKMLCDIKYFDILVRQQCEIINKKINFIFKPPYKSNGTSLEANMYICYVYKLKLNSLEIFVYNYIV